MIAGKLMKPLDVVVACGVMLAGLGVACAAHAQAANAATAFPAKSVRWVVPFPPGGITDVVARLIGQKMSETWGQSVVIDNRGGAPPAPSARNWSRERRPTVTRS